MGSGGVRRALGRVQVQHARLGVTTLYNNSTVAFILPSLSINLLRRQPATRKHHDTSGLISRIEIRDGGTAVVRPATTNA